MTNDDWWDALELALITTMLASMTLGACGPCHSLSDLRLRLHECAILRMHKFEARL
jgi:hypothetical protein